MMIRKYPLEWLDALILRNLVQNRNIINITEQELAMICDAIQKEALNIEIQIKDEVFATTKKSEVRLLIRKYHSYFIFLIDKIAENRKNDRYKTKSILQISQTIVDTLSNLLSFIETRFDEYLSLDQRVPLTYLQVSRRELMLRLRNIKKIECDITEDCKTLDLIIDSFNQHFQSRNAPKSTYRLLRYQKNLLHLIEKFNFERKDGNFFSLLDEKLINLNFNSADYYSYIITRIAAHLTAKNQKSGKLAFLLIVFKELNQIESSEKICFDPGQSNIKVSVTNWIKYETQYIEKSIELNIGQKEMTVSKEELQHDLLKEKVECILSTDQIGLILRAGDESRILKAKSMNQVFKSIVPYLSTSQKRDLSYKSMRSKSYTAEERDKEIAIKTLERIIKHIQQY
ncbi:hypothetical protein [Flavobacterium johnsoniae]|nr:hypothetical protein [Flavobacterium johnsoniae]OXE99800.1 hypothetical protein B0A63_10885 [Flavobacterium johnsoniae UW101]WQG82315.1 hypothetical protein SR927_04185 [Flavobacterium johnsoniae UW101]